MLHIEKKTASISLLNSNTSINLFKSTMKKVAWWIGYPVIKTQKSQKNVKKNHI